MKLASIVTKTSYLGLIFTINVCINSSGKSGLVVEKFTVF